MNATANAITLKHRISAEWTGNDGNQYRTFSYWMAEGWSNDFIQVCNNGSWQTLY